MAASRLHIRPIPVTHRPSRRERCLLRRPIGSGLPRARGQEKGRDCGPAIVAFLPAPFPFGPGPDRRPCVFAAQTRDFVPLDSFKPSEIPLIVRSAGWAVRQVWQICPGVLLLVCVLTAANALLPAALALTARGLVNSATVALSGENVSVVPLLPWLGLGFLLTLTEGLAALGSRYSMQRLGDELEVELTSRVLTKASGLDLSYFEDVTSQNQLERAQRGPAQQVFRFVSQMLDFGAASARVASLVGILVWIEPLTLAVVGLFAIPFLLLQWRVAASSYALERARSSRRRWNQYFVSTLTERDTLGEIKILRLAPLLIERFRSIMKEFRSEDRRLYLTGFRNESLFVVATTTGIYLLFARVGSLVAQGKLSLGDLAIFGGAAMRLRNGLTQVVNGATSMRTGALHVRDIRSFLGAARARGPASTVAEIPTTAEIVFDEVSFCYPGCSEKALDGISLRIEDGETVAVVGENGAGKSTLLRLVAGLYDPDDGVVRFGGRDLREFDREALFDQISFVFQTFSRFEASAADNIAYGHWARLLDARPAVEEVARRAGVDELLRGLPRGYDTLLGRRFGEADLSGGQWQRIAVARAFARPASLLILDEPTSNLDARAEFELFSRFQELARGRTAILVSHRFSTVRMADRILVLHGGKIVEFGSHEDLLAQGGTYAQLYRLQRIGNEP